MISDLTQGSCHHPVDNACKEGEGQNATLKEANELAVGMQEMFYDLL